MSDEQRTARRGISRAHGIRPRSVRRDKRNAPPQIGLSIGRDGAITVRALDNYQAPIAAMPWPSGGGWYCMAATWDGKEWHLKAEMCEAPETPNEE